MMNKQQSTLSIYIPVTKKAEAIRSRLKALAKERDRSENYLVVEAIFEYLENHESGPNLVLNQCEKSSTVNSPGEESEAREPEDPACSDCSAGTDPRTLAEWEDTLSRRVRSIELLGELELTPEQVDSVTSGVRVKILPFDLAFSLEHIVDNYPASYASCLVFNGMYEYETGAYWTRVLGLLRLTPDTSVESALGCAFETALRRLDLQTQFAGHRYVGKILGHAGIPLSVIPDVVRKLIVPFQADAALAKLPPAAQIKRWLKQGDAERLDKSVVRFFIYGGEAATQLVSKLIVLCRQGLPGGSEPTEPVQGGSAALREAVEKGLKPILREKRDGVRRRARPLAGWARDSLPERHSRGSAAWTPMHRADCTRRASSKPGLRRPRLVCIEDQGRWTLAVEMRGSQRVQMVTQAEDSLLRVGDRAFALTSLCEGIHVHSGTEVLEFPLCAEGKEAFLFRSARDWSSKGVICQRVTSGSYIAVVPSSWERDEERCGSPSIAATATNVPGYSAHSFNIEDERDAAIAFIKPCGSRYLCPYRSAVKLHGQMVPDQPEVLPPLFMHVFPAMELCKGLSWEEISEVHIRQHGQLQEKFAATPTECLDEQGNCVLPIGGSGTYEVRLLGLDGRELAFREVRFARGLRSLQIQGELMCPGREGHAPCELCFQVDGAAQVRLQNPQSELQVTQINGQIRCVIPPEPAFDQTAWLYEEESFQTPVTVDLSRIWWTVVDTSLSSLPPGWIDRPLDLKREEFRPTSKKVLLIRSKPEAQKCIQGTGFCLDNLRKHLQSEEPRVLKLPLRVLGDDDRLNDTRNECQLRLFAWHAGEARQAVLARVSAEFRCKICGQQVEDAEITAHIGSHALDIVTKMTYDEVREYLGPARELPTKILKCGYCDFYVPVPEGKNPDNEIKNHIYTSCRGVRPTYGTKTFRYTIVTDIDEIRREVVTNLPEVRKCRICGRVFERCTEDEIVQHVLGAHEKDVVDVRGGAES